MILINMLCIFWPCEPYALKTNLTWFLKILYEICFWIKPVVVDVLKYVNIKIIIKLRKTLKILFVSQSRQFTLFSLSPIFQHTIYSLSRFALSWFWFCVPSLHPSTPLFPCPYQTIRPIPSYNSSNYASLRFFFFLLNMRLSRIFLGYNLFSFSKKVISSQLITCPVSSTCLEIGLFNLLYIISYIC